MPRGPKGERRPADVIGNAIHVMKVLTGEAEEELDEPRAEKKIRCSSPPVSTSTCAGRM